MTQHTHTIATDCAAIARINQLIDTALPTNHGAAAIMMPMRLRAMRAAMADISLDAGTRRRAARVLIRDGTDIDRAAGAALMPLLEEMASANPAHLPHI